jgi:hypothetical protein
MCIDPCIAKVLSFGGLTYLGFGNLDGGSIAAVF